MRPLPFSTQHTLPEEAESRRMRPKNNSVHFKKYSHFGVFKDLHIVRHVICVTVVAFHNGEYIGEPVSPIKGNFHHKISVATMIELLLKSFLVYHSPMFEAWKVPNRPDEVSCDVTLHLVAYRLP